VEFWKKITLEASSFACCLQQRLDFNKIQLIVKDPSAAAPFSSWLALEPWTLCTPCQHQQIPAPPESLPCLKAPAFSPPSGKYGCGVPSANFASAMGAFFNIFPFQPCNSFPFSSSSLTVTPKCGLPGFVANFGMCHAERALSAHLR
jgi:hypothetical protein